VKLSEIALNSLTRSDGDDFDKFILRDIVKGDALEGLTDIFTKGCLQVSGSIKITLVRAVFTNL
jgi:hypothetical protein